MGMIKGVGTEEGIYTEGIKRLFGDGVFLDWVAKISEIFEEMREEFVKTDKYRGFDLDFEHLFMMKTGLSRSCFWELNSLSIEYQGLNDFTKNMEEVL